MKSRRKLAAIITGLGAVTLLAFGLSQLLFFFREPLDVTDVDLHFSVCKVVMPDHVASADKFDAESIVVRVPNEDLVPIVEGDFSEFKKSHPEPIEITVNNGTIFINDFVVEEDKVKYVARFCNVVYLQYQ